MTRDPRKDPQKGDVLRKEGITRTITEVNDMWVRWTTRNSSGSSWREVFRTWARDAEVVTGEE